ncbi:Hint domain-containing protein [Acetobacter persici]|uniref:Hint domain-containing protein n=1 Tax=Acetobacter persici TaxID=1076596 RepID=UPI0020CEDF83
MTTSSTTYTVAANGTLDYGLPILPKDSGDLINDTVNFTADGGRLIVQLKDFLSSDNSGSMVVLSINSNYKDTIILAIIGDYDYTGQTWYVNDPSQGLNLTVMNIIYNGNQVELNIPGNPFNLVNNVLVDTNTLLVDGVNNIYSIQTCFLAGSMIRTPDGDVAVEDIQIGDEVIAFDWRNNQNITRPVVWVGKTRAAVRPELSDDEAGWPVRILKDAIADGVPYKDMLITAEHCLFFKDSFVPVRMLVNGVSIFYDKSITSYDYYHVETEQHSVIMADGMLTESYLDTGNRSSFRQEGKIVTLRGAVKSWEGDAGAPLNVARSFVEPLYRALEWRENSASCSHSSAAQPELTTDPDLHLVTETGAIIRPMRQSAQNYNFMLPPETKSVRIVSRASRPSDVIGPFVDDRRFMGVAVGEINLQCAKQHHAITPHLQTEKPAGWQADMGWDGVAWTTGNAELPLGDYLSNGKMGILSLTVRAAGPYIVDNQKTAKSA